jgi:predicted MPP superfamily phosphohydrolase
LINDLHMGSYYPGYGGDGYSDCATGQEYFLTERLRKTVAWINDNKDGPGGIKFVAVNGDLTDSAEESEFYKAKEVLDGLAIPCVPLFGNHDAWPYTRSMEAEGPSGSEVFNSIFESTFAALATSAVVTGWARDTATAAGTPLNNYSFDAGGLHFLTLDLVSREAAPNGMGSAGQGVFHPETKTWLLDHLNNWGGGAPVVLLSHHPLTNRMIRPKHVGGFEWNFIRPLLAAGMPSDKDCKDITGCLQGHAEVLAAFAGHSHSAELLLGHLPTPPFIWDFNELGFEPIGAIEVKLTEALVAACNGPAGQDKGTIRIVKVTEDGKLDYSTVVGPESPGVNHALNPSFDVDIVDAHGLFIPHRFSKQKAEFFFDYGDGTDSGDFKAFSAGWWERTNLLDSVVHEYEDGRNTHLVTLTVREKNADGTYLEEKISREVQET